MTSIPDLWQLESDSPDWLPLIVDRLLTVGVPPTAIANAFDLDPQVVKDLLADRRVQKFGTSELAEALNILMWEAYEDLRTLQKTAPVTKRMQIDMTLIAKASSMIGSQEPDSMSKLQSQMDSMMAEVRSVPVDPGSSIYETNTLDAPTDNPEEGLTS